MDLSKQIKAAEKMRKNAQKNETTALTNTPANYLPPETIASISSVKKDKPTFDRLIAKTLLDIIMNGENNKEKMAAIDRYQKLTSSSQLLLKQGDRTVAVENTNDGPSVMNINLSSHVKTDEPEEAHEVKSRDLVAEKNAILFNESEYESSSSPVNDEETIEDAEFEIIEGV